MAPLWPFPSCDWPPPGDLVVDRPDGSSATHNVAIIDIGDHLDLTQVSPGRVLIDWPGLGLQDVGGPVTAGIYTLAIGANLILSYPAPGVAQLDGTGGGGSIRVIGGAAFTVIIDPCITIAFDASSGISTVSGGGGEAIVALYAATPTQAGAMSTGSQSFGGLKTFKDGITIGVPPPGTTAKSFWSFLPEPDTGGVTSAFVMGTWDVPGPHTIGTGVIYSCTDRTAYFQGCNLQDGVPQSYNQTSLAVYDAATVPHVGLWQNVTFPGAQVLGFSGGLYTGGPLTINLVASVSMSGGTTGLTFTVGGTSTAPTFTLGGVLDITNGGTGATTAGTGLAALLPSQTGQAGKALVTNGTTASWQPPAGGLSESQALDLIWQFG